MKTKTKFWGVFRPDGVCVMVRSSVQSAWLMAMLECVDSSRNHAMTDTSKRALRRLGWRVVPVRVVEVKR